MAKMKVYFLHNIDGRRCAMIAATSKVEVRKRIRISAEEICVAGHSPEGQRAALAEPGVLFVQEIGSRNDVWRRSR